MAIMMMRKKHTKAVILKSKHINYRDYYLVNKLTKLGRCDRTAELQTAELQTAELLKLLILLEE